MTSQVGCKSSGSLLCEEDLVKSVTAKLLEDATKEGHEFVVSWQPHGRAFRVHKPKLFSDDILPRYFNQTKLKSFQRQLHIYGFRRVARKTSMDSGAYYHEFFLRGNKDLCMRMTRQKIKSPKEQGPPPPRQEQTVAEPDFYAHDLLESKHDSPHRPHVSSLSMPSRSTSIVHPSNGGPSFHASSRAEDSSNTANNTIDNNNGERDHLWPAGVLCSPPKEWLDTSLFSSIVGYRNSERPHQGKDMNAPAALVSDNKLKRSFQDDGAGNETSFAGRRFFSVDSG